MVLTRNSCDLSIVFHEQIAVKVRLPVAVVKITNMVSSVYLVTVIILAALDHVIQSQGHVTAERV